MLLPVSGDDVTALEKRRVHRNHDRQLHRGAYDGQPRRRRHDVIRCHVTSGLESRRRHTERFSILDLLTACHQTPLASSLVCNKKNRTGGGKVGACQ